MAYTPGVLASI